MVKPFFKKASKDKTVLDLGLGIWEADLLRFAQSFDLQL
jgi:hypothetical protein